MKNSGITKLALTLAALILCFHPPGIQAQPGSAAGSYLFSSMNALIYGVCFVAIVGNGFRSNVARNQISV